MTLYVVIMVCAASVANCTPATMTIVQSAIAPGEHEYVRQRCELRQY